MLEWQHVDMCGGLHLSSQVQFLPSLSYPIPAAFACSSLLTWGERDSHACRTFSLPSCYHTMGSLRLVVIGGRKREEGPPAFFLFLDIL